MPKLPSKNFAFRDMVLSDLLRGSRPTCVSALIRCIC